MSNDTGGKDEFGRDRSRIADSSRRNHQDSRGTTPHERNGPAPRRRSRSPDDLRHERGGRRAGGNRYRERSPIRESREAVRRTDTPTGPRGGAARRPPTGPASSARPPFDQPEPAVKPEEEKDPDVKMEDKPDDMDEETWVMQQVMGFTSFKSTKETKVPGNDKNYGVRKEKVMQARQYMNRKGGFNRPLSPER
ncbi:hypothetical protein P154DRAFT_141757 [Amniculicola lignicola CBS 123094]|uniref:U4/U6.U5 small nuclear ribonucleoprotein 27kDa protein domain-containing protein n=1 Tax=Amniculicola lignicola CBS 123094 TaxID=1392246 RepID=A0A6A5WY30_9PLEO|nr:hypothetical protein P154DRAFT_141757 [Amniculicola lignicola CBS 123094]